MTLTRQHQQVGAKHIADRPTVNPGWCLRFRLTRRVVVTSHCPRLGPPSSAPVHQLTRTWVDVPSRSHLPAFRYVAYRTALSVCHDRECAQDAVQDAFVSMWSSRATYEPARGTVAGWANEHRPSIARSTSRDADQTLRNATRGLLSSMTSPPQTTFPPTFAAHAETEQLTGLPRATAAGTAQR